MALGELRWAIGQSGFRGAEVTPDLLVLVISCGVSAT